MPHNTTFVCFRFRQLLKQSWLIISLLLLLSQTVLAKNDYQILPAQKAFHPQLTVEDDHIKVHFTIAPNHYLYRNKITITTQPDRLFNSARFVQQSEQKHDQFFGKQLIYHNQLDVIWSYTPNKPDKSYEFKLIYQGCAETGICYPPVEKIWTINPLNKQQFLHTSTPFQTKAKKFQLKQEILQAKQANTTANTLFQLSRTTIITNLMAFFIAGLGLSLTACMYPLLPIVSAIVVGTKQHTTKWRAFVLSFIYVQGLALTYTIVGIVTAQTGTFLNGWLQQPVVVLSAAVILVIMALAMFDLYHIQMPVYWQSFFQNTSNRLHGGQLISVFLMGAISALIVGPCVAPPLAFALGYIGQSGDALLGGLALYVMAIGTGVPLILISVFGVHILPQAGSWMTKIKYLFGLILLIAATYIATPFLNYKLVIIIYTVLMLLPAIYLYWCWRHSSGHQQIYNALAGLAFLFSGLYFVTASAFHHVTPFHHFLTLTEPKEARHFGQKFTDPQHLRQVMQQLFTADPHKPVVVDFYADWCISCKEMNAFTFSNAKVREVLDEKRFLQIDVTNNTYDQQILLHQYDLYGPPGVFVVQSNGFRSKPLLGYVSTQDFLLWYDLQMKKM